jgi:hypothetical protein
LRACDKIDSATEGCRRDRRRSEDPQVSSQHDWLHAFWWSFAKYTENQLSIEANFGRGNTTASVEKIWGYFDSRGTRIDQIEGSPIICGGSVCRPMDRAFVVPRRPRQPACRDGSSGALWRRLDCSRPADFGMRLIAIRRMPKWNSTTAQGR